MPHVVNGIGTWYWGKRNVVSRQGVCDQCGRAGTLQSYDTRLFFVVLFLPIIPLRKYHVAHECPACKRHRVMRLDQWEAARRTEVMDAVAACQASPRDEQKALHAIELAAGYEHTAALDALTTFVDREHPRSAKVRAALGMALKNIGKPQEATATLRDAHALDASNVDIRRQLALCEFQHGDPALGKALIADVLSGKAKEDLGMAFLAVESFQAHARHDEALETLARLETAYPDLAQDKEFQRYQRVSSKHRGTSKKVTHGLIATGKGVTPARETPIRNKLALIIGPALALLAIAGFLFTALRVGAAREVWIVNGLTQPSTATLNGVAITLRPQEATRTRVAMGDVSMSYQVEGTSTWSPAEVVRVHESFFARPFSRRVFVLNPDRNAVLEVETATYSPVGSATQSLAGDGFVFSTGKPLHEFADGTLNYVFTPFPPQAKLSGRSPQQYKRLGVTLEQDPRSMHALLASELGESVANDRLLRQLAAQPAREELYAVAREALEPQAFRAAIEPALALRPLVMEAHREHQNALMLEGDMATARLMYEKLLAQEPSNPDLQYLLARTLEDPKASRRYLASAANDPARPSAYAMMALASSSIDRGEFGEALSLATRAFERMPDHPQVREVYANALHASGDDQRLLQELDRLEPEPLRRITERLYLFAKLGRKDEAFAGLQALLQEVPAEFRAQFEHAQRCNILATLGDDAAAAKAVDDGQLDPSGILSALLRRDLAKLREAWAPTKDSDVRDVPTCAQVAIAASMLGDDTLADDARQELAQRLTAGGWTQAGAMLTNACPTFEDVRELELDPSLKSTLCVVLGQRCPAIRRDSFALARVLNFDKRFPASLIEEATSGR